MPNTPLINGNAYDWASVRVVLFGKTVEGITAVNYEEKQEKVNNMGRGNQPVSRGRGKKEYTASITLEMKEVQAIQEAAGKGKSLTDIAPFDVEVVYFNELNKKVVDKIRMAEFTNNKREAKTGDGSLYVECELLPGYIEFNA